MSSRILSVCLLFKNEVHRNKTLSGAVRVAYVKCVREFGSRERRKLRKDELVACTVYRKLCGWWNQGELNGWCVWQAMWRAKCGKVESEMLRNTHEEDYLWNLGVNGRIILEWTLNVWAGREWYGLVWLLVGTTGEKVSSINYVESLWRTAVRAVAWLVVFMRGFWPNWPQRLAFCRQPHRDSW